MTCTWVDCSKEATVPQIAKDGDQWANLCVEHDAEIDKALVSMDVKVVLRNWLRAQGGAKAAAARMTGRRT